ncbi:hypothetical protein IMCC3317_17410 [Kordia antarctica]|uniref:Uracil DNA glycosylase superfamily protein n=1 Tax=Kordia antarctica TaxID=1218801 RepID=A0A7L4ZIX7_9FLAO|nr:hypothetical protein [Kordia antarctica]QHI36379.1 hypothetical protein IMCC3317_17410 [Kordia antarctica]
MFLEKIKKEILKEKYSKEELLKDEYLIDSESQIKIYYAPFEYINKKASVIIVGITPGWSQMEKSFRTVIRELQLNKSLDSALKTVKSESSFAGSMRKNLVKMLDELELNKTLKLESTNELFNLTNNSLHTTSIIKYPVFNKGENYRGSSPSVINTDILWKQVEKEFVPEINNFTDALIIPLGKSVEETLRKLQSEKMLNENLILYGFPHPSGANGHRFKQFESNKESMKQKISNWKITI